MTPRPTFSPREIARAIGVSESSVKRWIDAGRLPAHRTVGGHRRIDPTDAIRFVRETGRSWVDPSSIGLDEARRVAPLGRRGREEEAFYDLLVAGWHADFRGLVQRLYLEGWSIADLIDGPLRAAMQRIGERWPEAEDGVLTEHGATSVAIDALVHLRSLLREDAAAPLAIGGAPAEDPYSLPSLAVSTVLRAAGFAIADLGARTPLATLAGALREKRPKILWISLSSAAAAPDLEGALPSLLTAAEEEGATVALGGGASADLEIRPHPALFVGRSMAELDAFARGLLSGAQ